jgi:hypothetical protein
MQREVHIIINDENQKELSKAIGYVSLFLSISGETTLDEITRHKKIITIDLTNLPEDSSSMV